MKITEKEKLVLTALAQHTRETGEFCVGFKYLEGYAGDLDIRQIRLGCRSLRRKGLAEFYRGLFNEDGEVAGSGYCISNEGRELADKLEL
jgi:hypothetical protein